MNNHTDVGPDSYKCMHYAQFAKRLDFVGFDTVYWILFISVILLLFYASTTYDKCVKATNDLQKGSPEFQKEMMRCLLICSLCTAVAVVAVVMETFALLALQFCDVADLMMLYWSTWTMLQVGSVIAIFGVMLAVFHTVRDRKPPAWGLALGTPVLVVAGLGHFFHDCVYKRLKNRFIGYKERREGLVSISQSSTLRAATPVNEEDTKFVARYYGVTPDGGTIIELTKDIPNLSPSDTHIATGEDGKVLVACGKDSEIARIVSDSQTARDVSIAAASAVQPPAISSASWNMTTHEPRPINSCPGPPAPTVAGPSRTPTASIGNSSTRDRAISFSKKSSNQDTDTATDGVSARAGS